MKKTTTLIAALVMVMGAAFATEGEKTTASKVSVVKWNQDTHQLFYLGKEEGKVMVKVTDEDGNLLLKRSIKNENGFALPMNFKNQEAGNYQIHIQDGEDSYTETLEVIKG